MFPRAKASVSDVLVKKVPLETESYNSMGGGKCMLDTMEQCVKDKKLLFPLENIAQNECVLVILIVCI